MSGPHDSTEPGELREYLQRVHGTDYGASDEVLIAMAEEKKALVRKTARRSSWMALAAEALRIDSTYDGPLADE